MSQNDINPPQRPPQPTQRTRPHHNRSATSSPRKDQASFAPLSSGLPAGYVAIEPGAFLMGRSPNDHQADDNEGPAHHVTLSRGFYLKATPVTQAQWQEVMGFHRSRDRGPNRPAEQISWYEAIAFCNALSRKEKLPEAYELHDVPQKPGDRLFSIGEVFWDRESPGYRLPTEAEWEYACRANSTTPRYGELDRIAWYCNNCPTTTTQPVGQKQPNAWGLYDMLGNVFEWVFDAAYRPYTPEPAVDPLYEEGIARIGRGGSWSGGDLYCRASTRFALVPSLRAFYLGLRPCRTIP